MEVADIPGVLEVDRESYPLPWPASAYRREISNNRHARYVVLREESSSGSADDGAPRDHRRGWLPWAKPRAPETAANIVGYAGMWIVADEAHVTTIAVRRRDRGRGLGELLLVRLIEIAYELGIRWMTLEVRVSNETAQNLYRKYSFRNAGIRKRYYSDNNEDALIMTTDDITLAAYRTRFDELRQTLSTRLASSEPAVALAEPR